MSSLLTESELENFSSLLESYQPDSSALEQFKASNFAVIAGPAGAGKDTLRNALLAKNPQTYVRVLSTTTRPMRPGEQEGVDYQFRSLDQVEKGLKDHEFFQAQLVHNQQISCMHVSEILKLGPSQIGLSILVVQTEAQLYRIKPDIRTIFLIPPSLEVLESRMQAERVLDPYETARRLKAAKSEMEIALNRPDYYCVTSDDVPDMVRIADEFLRNGQRSEGVNQDARIIIQNVLKEL